MQTRKQHKFQRRAAAIAMVAVCGTVIVGMAALAIDMGMLYSARTEAQRAADAGALAGARQLINDNRLKGTSGMTTVIHTARSNASSIASQNKVFNANPVVDQGGDVTVGRLNNPYDHTEVISSSGSLTDYNSVKVLIHRDETRNGPIPLIFAQIFGVSSKNLSASAVAIAEDAIVGFRRQGNGPNPQVLPIAVDVSTWQALLAGTLRYQLSNGDAFSVDPSTNTVISGGDGIPELNIFPGGAGNQGGAGNGGGSLQLTPGNWGTLNIPTGNNSTQHLGEQIRFGLSQADLAGYPNGEFKLNSDGTLLVSGDPGMSNGIKDDLTAIIGQARTIPLYSTVQGNGNNTTYTLVGFAGARIVGVNLTGSPGSRYVLAQPATVIDRAAVSSPTVSGTSYYVYRPPMLVR